jgi:hypothetical protein
MQYQPSAAATLRPMQPRQFLTSAKSAKPAAPGFPSPELRIPAPARHTPVQAGPDQAVSGTENPHGLFENFCAPPPGCYACTLTNSKKQPVNPSVHPRTKRRAHGSADKGRVPPVPTPAPPWLTIALELSCSSRHEPRRRPTCPASSASFLPSFPLPPGSILPSPVSPLSVEGKRESINTRQGEVVSGRKHLPRRADSPRRTRP